MMIKSFGSKDTKKLWQQIYVASLPTQIQSRALQKLIAIDFAENLNDLRVPPGNHLEKLQSKYNNLYSIRIQGQYRITFRYFQNNFYEVEVVDYHD